jgi:hypothetical protein
LLSLQSNDRWEATMERLTERMANALGRIERNTREGGIVAG